MGEVLLATEVAGAGDAETAVDVDEGAEATAAEGSGAEEGVLVGVGFACTVAGTASAEGAEAGATVGEGAGAVGTGAVDACA